MEALSRFPLSPSSPSPYFACRLLNTQWALKSYGLRVRCCFAWFWNRCVNVPPTAVTDCRHAWRTAACPPSLDSRFLWLLKEHLTARGRKGKGKGQGKGGGKRRIIIRRGWHSHRHYVDDCPQHKDAPQISPPAPRPACDAKDRIRPMRTKSPLSGVPKQPQGAKILVQKVVRGEGELSWVEKVLRKNRRKAQP